MKYIYSFLAMMMATISVYAQSESDSLETEEVVISAMRVQEKKADIAQPVTVITQQTLKSMNAQTTADVMEKTGEILVQKSQQGGGSPIIRGFEANRVVLTLDGIRLNNILFRGGHLQNIILIDNNALRRAEILYGPGSTMYGSDALGGVLSFYTLNATPSETGRLSTKGGGFLRYSSANQEKTGHFDLNIGGKKWASLTSVTLSDFGDLRAGSVYNQKYPELWKRNQYVVTTEGKDSLYTNSNPQIQKFTGYKQYNVVQKVVFKPNQTDMHSLNVYLTSSTNIPRYDRLTEAGSGGQGLRFAEWYYGPQKWNVFAYQFHHRPTEEGKGNLFVNAYYQAYEESRHNRRWGRSDISRRTERVKVAGVNVDWDKKMGKHDLRVGGEAIVNFLTSTAFNENIVTGVQSPLDTRYPDGKNQLTTAAAYLSHTYLLAPKWVLNEGVRLSYIHLQSTFNDTSFFAFPFQDAKQSHLPLSGNVGLIFQPTQKLRIAANANSGFRAPNVDDLAKVFESASGMLIVPNPNLQPERTYTTDVGFRKTFGSDAQLVVEGTVFHTWFVNAIVTDKFTYENQDSVIFDGVKSQVMANQNKRSAFLYGATGAIHCNFTPHLRLSSTLTYTVGKIRTDSTPANLDHIPPLYGKTVLEYSQNKWSARAWAAYNGNKPISQYFLNGEDNEQYATPDGMPAWWTLNISGGYKWGKYLEGMMGVENLLDRHYRVFASGMSAPGRNVFVRVGVSF